MIRRTVICLLLLPPIHVQADEWSRFRGPNGGGLGEDVVVPADGKTFVWKTKLAGKGHSSPVLCGNRIFVTSGVEATATGFLQCLDAASGKEVWRRDIPGKKLARHEDNSLASSTPAVTSSHLVSCWAHSGELVIVAHDHDGNARWKTNLGPFRGGHGFGVSPIVEDEVVLIANDGPSESFLSGIDLATGGLIWKVPRQCRSHYATPCVLRRQGEPTQVLCVTYEHGLSSVDARTGKLRWELDIFDKRHVESSIASPIVAGDLVLASSGWLGVRQEIVAVKLGTVAPAKDSIVYRVDKAAPLVPTPVVHDGLLFSWNDRGVVACLELATGKEHWRERVPGTYYGSPVCAADKLIGV